MPNTAAPNSATTGHSEHPGRRQQPKTLPADVQRLSWVAEQLGVGLSTAYRLAEAGHVPGAFKVGAQWRISVPRFWREIHGEGTLPEAAPSASASQSPDMTVPGRGSH